MKKTWKTLALPFLAIAVLGVASCQKLVDDATETTTSSEDYADDQQTLNDLTDMVLDIAENDASLKKSSSPFLPDGVDINWLDDQMDGDGVSFYIDLGELTDNDDEDVENETLGQLCRDAKVRAGKIRVYVTKPLEEIGCVITVDFPKGFLLGTTSKRVKLKKQSDNLTITRVSATQWDIHFSYKATYYDKSGKKKKKKRTTKFNGDYHFNQTAGVSTPEIADDVYEVTGSSENTNSDDKDYSVDIREKLVRKGDATCSKTFVSGKVDMKNKGSKFKLETDFGNGDCDNIVKVKINGIEHTVTVD